MSLPETEAIEAKGFLLRPDWDMRSKSGNAECVKL